jgi:hypothetical protein
MNEFSRLMRELGSPYSVDGECAAELSRKLGAEGATPYEFMVHVRMTDPGQMYPKAICSESMWIGFMEARRMRIAESRARLALHRNRLIQLLKDGMTPADAAATADAQFCYLLRYILARSADSAALADRYRPAAQYEVRAQPELPEILLEWDAEWRPYVEELR